jgi:hypothetical protein
MKLAIEPDTDAVRHWRGELVAFHSEMTGRYAPSMRQRLDLDELWRSAREQTKLAYEGTLQEDRVAGLATHSPLALDDLLGERIDSGALVERLRCTK